MAAQLREVPGFQVARTPPGQPRIERDDDPFVPGSFGPLDEALRELTIRRRIQLKKARRCTEVRGNVFERALFELDTIH